MNKDLFQNDQITGNSQIGFEFGGQFKDDENIIISKLKEVLNREISFSNVEYKLLEPTDSSAVLIKDGKSYIVKTPQYTYFEAVFILPKILEFLKTLKEYKNSYLYFKLGFNDKFCDISQINVMKFILEFNEDYVLKHLIDQTQDGTVEKLNDIKPVNLDACVDDCRKRMEILKFTDDSIYGINFYNLKLGYITFMYACDMNYRSKWEEILKCINHTIITIYNSCKFPELTDEEQKKVDEIDQTYKDIAKAFDCYELFKDRYKNIKFSKDLNRDQMEIGIIFPSIKDKLFDIVVKNGIKTAEINYDSDISKLQLKNIELKKCHYLNGVDIVESEIENCSLKDCDIYDTKIIKSNINKCNLFGYADCKECKLTDVFVSRNIKLKDCDVTGQLGKMGGIMKGGSLKNTTVITSMADIDNDVEKTNVNEIQ